MGSIEFRILQRGSGEREWREESSMMSEKEKELKGLGGIWVDPKYVVDRLQISRPIEIPSFILFFCVSVSVSVSLFFLFFFFVRCYWKKA